MIKHRIGAGGFCEAAPETVEEQQLWGRFGCTGSRETSLPASARILGRVQSFCAPSPSHFRAELVSDRRRGKARDRGGYCKTQTRGGPILANHQTAESDLVCQAKSLSARFLRCHVIGSARMGLVQSRRGPAGSLSWGPGRRPSFKISSLAALLSCRLNTPQQPDQHLA